VAASATLAAASVKASSLFSSLDRSRKKRASSSPERYFSQDSRISFRPACSFRTVWAFSPSFQKSGRAVTWFSSSSFFRLPSRSKTPPEKLQTLLQVS